MSKSTSKEPMRTWLVLICIIVLGIALNIIGSEINGALGLPLYLDCAGTTLAAMLGGGLPCITAGFLTNIILGFSAPDTTYYCVFSVMIAAAAVYFSNDLCRLRIKSILLSILTFAFIGGVGGGLLTWMIGGFSFGEGYPVELAAAINSVVPIGEVVSNLLACMLVDIVDKAIIVLFSIILYKLIPARFGEYCRSCIWHFVNIFLSRRQKNDPKFSIRRKVTLLVTTTTSLVAASAIAISIFQYHGSTLATYEERGHCVTQVVASKIDKEKIGDYLEHGRSVEGYDDFEELLYALRESSPEITYLYVYKIAEDGSHVIFDLDTPQLEADEPGDVLEHDSTVSKYLNEFLSGKGVSSDITNDSFGWLFSVYQPILDENGVPLAYVGVDLAMDRLNSMEIAFLARIFSLFLGFLFLIRTYAVWIAERAIIHPINAIADVATRFTVDTADARKEGLKAINELEIHTGDEIENLYESYKKATSATVHYIDEALQKGEQIRRLQGGLILVLADIVESRDKCTGDHVRKTAVYSEIILKQMQADGIYADQLSDQFIEEVVNSAPLHDIGKIQVPDAILNKPGRLTDEEFRQMQRHAEAGGEIIEKAIAVVGESSDYLNEAKNLAAYHHEKWNGKGYPCGLSGEDIPLSARVMAVADVFDALVSRRSYKEPFSVDTAIDIIREGSGNHFDPEVVRAFLKAEDKIRETAQMNLEI